MKKYSIIFKGKDYTEFDYSPIITDCNGDLVRTEEFPLNLHDLFVAFLDSFDKRDLSCIVKNLEQEGEKEENEEKKKLYTKSADGTCRFNGLIGFLRRTDFIFPIGAAENSEYYELDITLQCTSRFDGDKGYFLCSLLLHNDLSFVDSLIPTDDNDDIFDYMLLFRYLSLLKESVVKGYYKKYVTFYNNDDRLRGTIDIARHLKQNSGFNNGKVAYSYRENTVKNPLNMLIVEAYQILKSKYAEIMDGIIDWDVEQAINTLKAELGYYYCSHTDLIKMNSKAINHPLYFEYESMRKICLKVLRDEGMNLFTSEELDTANGYLVYVPNLWEKYLKDHFEEFSEWSVISQDSNNVVSPCDAEDNKTALTIRPDFVFYNLSGNKKLILDAKFIPKWKTAVEKNDFSKVSNDFNKCVRDMTCLELNKTGVIFPTRGHKTFKSYKINKSSLFYALGIEIPNTSEYDNFYLWNLYFENGVKKQIEELIPAIN